jgi:DNA-binding MarR family transcriptional regulator
VNDDLDTLEEALGYLGRAFSRPKIWQDIQRTAKIDIDRPSAHLLKVLSDQPAGCRLQELANKIGVEAPSVSRAVQRLERDKFIVRITDQADRRATHLRLTARGVKTLASLREAKREHFRNLFQSWGANDRKQLVQSLHKLARQAAELSDSSIIKTSKETK